MNVLATDLFAVFVEGLALYCSMLHLFALHLDEVVALSIVEEEVLEVVLVIVPLGHNYLGIAEGGVHILAMQTLLVQVPVLTAKTSKVHTTSCLKS